MNLASLRPSGRRLLTPAFLAGERECAEAERREHVAPLERPVALDGFEEVVRRALREGLARPVDDGRLAVELHQALRLTRREAAEIGVWRYLAVVAGPELIRRRWRADQKTFASRFWSPGTRPDSNYYARLWWIAELSSGPDGDYERTRRALRSQALATAIFVRNFCHYFPAVKACVEVLADEAQERVARAARELYRELALVPREALAAEDIAEFLRDELARE